VPQLLEAQLPQLLEAQLPQLMLHQQAHKARVPSMEWKRQQGLREEMELNLLQAREQMRDHQQAKIPWERRPKLAEHSLKANMERGSMVNGGTAEEGMEEGNMAKGEGNVKEEKDRQEVTTGTTTMKGMVVRTMLMTQLGHLLAKTLQVVQSHLLARDPQPVQILQQAKDLQKAKDHQKVKDLQKEKDQQPEKDLRKAKDLQLVQILLQVKDLELVQSLQQAKDLQLVQSLQQAKDLQPVQNLQQAKDLQLVQILLQVRDLLQVLINLLVKVKEQAEVLTMLTATWTATHRGVMTTLMTAQLVANQAAAHLAAVHLAVKIMLWRDPMEDHLWLVQEEWARVRDLLARAKDQRAMTILIKIQPVKESLGIAPCQPQGVKKWVGAGRTTRQTQLQCLPQLWAKAKS